MSAPSAHPPLPERSASFVLSAVSGFVDTAGFILLSGIFTAHVTGNLVLAGAVLAGQYGHGGVWPRLALMALFMLAVALASWIAQRCGALVVRSSLHAEALALLVFLVVGLIEDHQHQGHFSDASLFFISAAAVAAMGVQNALMRGALKDFLPTTMMTGNTTQFTLDLWLWAQSPGAARSNGVNGRLARFGNVLAGFLLGSALGATGAVTLRFWCMVAPLAAVVVLAAKAVAIPPASDPKS